MLLLWILLWIFLLLLFLLCCPLTVSLSYEAPTSPPALPESPEEPLGDTLSQTDQILAQLLAQARQTLREQAKEEKQLSIRLHYLFFCFSIFPLKARKTKTKTKTKLKAPAEEKGKSESKFSEKLAALATLWQQIKASAPLPLRLLRHSILIHHLRLKFVVAKEDACETAMAYRTLCISLGVAMGLWGGILQQRSSKIELIPDFSGDSEHSELAGKGRVRLFPLGILAAIIVFAVSFLIQYLNLKNRTVPEASPPAPAGPAPAK